jgi:hypothetical protein
MSVAAPGATESNASSHRPADEENAPEGDHDAEAGEEKGGGRRHRLKPGCDND